MTIKYSSEEQAGIDNEWRQLGIGGEASRALGHVYLDKRGGYGFI
jgi:hypothetical protein